MPSFEPLPEADLFDVEYWSLEQPKLGSAKEPPLAGQVAVITGTACAIGFATAKAFAAASAEVALLDVDEAAVQAKAKSIGGAALGIRCDVIDAASVKGAFARVASAFGGVDIVVSNAGAAWQGRIGEVDEAVLRESFELNFYGHQRVAQAAVKSCGRRAPAAACCSMCPNRPSIPDPMLGLMACRKRRRCFSCGNTRCTDRLCKK
jgi:NAD(P)-dependent dehydrogenase (short-subunit alcohol dehydrogenase family)